LDPVEHTQPPAQPGDIIEVVSIADQWTTLTPGTRGTVTRVDALGTVFADWHGSTSTLGLVPDEDVYRIVEPEPDDRVAKVAGVDRRRGHPFLPPADVMASVPKLYDTESVLTKDKMFVLHFFVAGCDWWIAEVDPDTWTAFGFANLGDPQNAEWGYVDLLELGEVMAADGMLVVERDLHWTPAKASDVIGERFGR
jgi:hypothetical protein